MPFAGMHESDSQLFAHQRLDIDIVEAEATPCQLQMLCQLTRRHWHVQAPIAGSLV